MKIKYKIRLNKVKDAIPTPSIHFEVQTNPQKINIHLNSSVTKEKRNDEMKVGGRTRSVKNTTGRTSTTAKIRKVDATQLTHELG